MCKIQAPMLRQEEDQNFSLLNWLVNGMTTDKIPRYHNRTGCIREKK